MLQKQLTIDEQGGIVTKLNNEADDHNGFSYWHFDLFCRLHIPNTVIAKLMNMKATSTIRDWKEHRVRHLKSQRDSAKNLKSL